MEGLIVAALFFVVFWLLIIRPNQRRMRAHQDLLRTLEVGDEIMTGSGFYGRIVGLDDDMAQVELAPGVTVRMARAAIAKRTVEPYRANEGDPEAGPPAGAGGDDLETS